MKRYLSWGILVLVLCLPLVGHAQTQVIRPSGGAASAPSPSELDLDITEACASGQTCGPTDLTEQRPWKFAPEDTLGPSHQIFGGDGNLYQRFKNFDGTNASPWAPCSLAPGTCCTFEAQIGDPLSWVPIGEICNPNGTGVTFTGIFNEPEAANVALSLVTGLTATDVQAGMGELGARTEFWHLPWTASGAIVDGALCVKSSTNVQLNSGPNVIPLTCSDAAGTIELSFDTPARYNGGEITACFEIVDDVDADNVWDAAVIAQHRPLAQTVNNTWSTAVEASVTLATADAPYFACATFTPNGATAGVGRLFIKATIDNAGGHTDSDGRVLGGYVFGR